MYRNALALVATMLVCALTHAGLPGNVWGQIPATGNPCPSVITQGVPALKVNCSNQPCTQDGINGTCRTDATAWMMNPGPVQAWIVTPGPNPTITPGHQLFLPGTVQIKQCLCMVFTGLGFTGWTYIGAHNCCQMVTAWDDEEGKLHVGTMGICGGDCAAGSCQASIGSGPDGWYAWAECK